MTPDSSAWSPLFSNFIFPLSPYLESFLTGKRSVLLSKFSSLSPIGQGGKFYLFADSPAWTAEAYGSLSMMVAIP